MSGSARSPGVELVGDRVIATFKVKTPSKFGTETAAAIKVKTLLGAMFIALEPAGSGQLKEDSTIPVSRTTSPYNVVQAFSGLADRAERIDTDRLAKSINTLAALTKEHAPPPSRAPCAGSPDSPRPSPAATTRSGSCCRTWTRSPARSPTATRTSSR